MPQRRTLKERLSFVLSSRPVGTFIKSTDTAKAQPKQKHVNSKLVLMILVCHYAPYPAKGAFEEQLWHAHDGCSCTSALVEFSRHPLFDANELANKMLDRFHDPSMPAHVKLKVLAVANALVNNGDRVSDQTLAMLASYMTRLASVATQTLHDHAANVLLRSSR